MTTIKEPDEMFKWIKSNWVSLKKSNKLEEAITRWLKVSPTIGLTASDIIWIEENI
jgi:hypothetical protein